MEKQGTASGNTRGKVKIQDCGEIFLGDAGKLAVLASLGLTGKKKKAGERGEDDDDDDEDTRELKRARTEEETKQQSLSPPEPTVQALHILRKHKNSANPSSWRAKKIGCSKAKAMGLHRQCRFH